MSDGREKRGQSEHRVGEADRPRGPGRRLPSIFDGLPAGGPLDMAALEAAMEADLARRAMACLDRALARRAAAT